MSELDLSAAYRVKGWPGVAVVALGHVVTREWPECLGHESLDGPIGNTVYCDGSCACEPDEVTDYDRARVVMVGDDRVHVVDVDDLVRIDELDYCASCGQIGCGHDGRERG